MRELMAKSKKTKTRVEPIDLGDGPVTPIGVDASWTGLAVCALERERLSALQQIQSWDGGKLTVRLAEVLSTKPGDFPSRSARLERLGCSFIRTIFTAEANRGETTCLVAIEGYAMGAKFGRELAGELCGHLKLLLWQAGVPYIVVPPTSVKKYAIGKGVAAKELMMMTTLKRWGYEAPDNNACDAYVLSRIAAEFAAGNWTKKFAELAQGFECVPAKGGGS